MLPPQYTKNHSVSLPLTYTQYWKMVTIIFLFPNKSLLHLWKRTCFDFATESVQWLSTRCCRLVAQSCPTLLWPHGLKPSRLICPWDSPGKNTGVGCHFLLQGIFLTQGSNPHLLRWQADSLPMSHPYFIICLAALVLVVPCGIWFPDQGSNPGPLQREYSLSHWTTREVLPW